MKKTPLIVYLTEELIEKVERMAQKNYTTRQSIIRKLIGDATND